jgi:hypothetical protein
VRLLLAEGGGHLPDTLTVRLPSSIRATIHERLRPLTPACAHMLEAAAVIGREFDLPTLCATIGDDGPGLLEALALAEAASVIVRRRGALPRYGFAHALTREALYESMPSDVRMAWHQRVGEALERLHAGDLGPHLDELAHHFAHAASSDAAEKAIAYDVRAAERASGMLAYEAAVRHLQRALYAQALVVAPDAGAILDLRLQLGEMQAAAWANDAAKATFHAAAEQGAPPRPAARGARAPPSASPVSDSVCRAASSTARWSRCSRKRCAACRRAIRCGRASPSASPSSCTSPPTSSGARRSARRRWPRRGSCRIRRPWRTSSTRATSRCGTRPRSRSGWRWPTRRCASRSASAIRISRCRGGRGASWISGKSAT